MSHICGVKQSRMKTKITIVLLTIFLVGKSFSQYGESVALIGGVKFRSDLRLNGDTVTISSLEFGFGRSGGYSDQGVSWGILSLSENWGYLTPYATVEYSYMTKKGGTDYLKADDGASPVMLNLGVSGGIGKTLFIFPLGICASAGISTDFTDTYLSYSYGICAYGLSIEAGGLLNLSNKNKSFYKAKPYGQVKFIWNLFD